MIKARRLGDVDCVAEPGTRGLFLTPLLNLIVDRLSGRLSWLNRLDRLAEDERIEHVEVRAWQAFGAYIGRVLLSVDM